MRILLFLTDADFATIMGSKNFIKKKTNKKHIKAKKATLFHFQNKVENIPHPHL